MREELQRVLAQMSGVRADWGQAQIAVPDQEGDPFAKPVEELGVPIDLTSDRPTLQARFNYLMEREAKMEAAGITCPIKWDRGHDCRECPLSQATSKDDVLGCLCRVGVKQFHIADALGRAAA